MSLAVMKLAQADGPPVRRLHAHAAIEPSPHMRAFDRVCGGSRGPSRVAPGPRAMPRTAAHRGPGSGLRQRAREDQLRHAQAPCAWWVCAASIWVRARDNQDENPVCRETAQA